jgi:TRAP-type transport system periplasmic protein
MNFGGVAGALKQGQIDGQENPIDIIVSSKLYEVQKYITVWNYSYDALILGMNKKAWDNLPAADQAVIKQAASEASREQVKLSREAARTQLGLLLDKGMTITELTPEQAKAFRSTVEPVYSEWSGKFDSSIQMFVGN